MYLLFFLLLGYISSLNTSANDNSYTSLNSNDELYIPVEILSSSSLSLSYYRFKRNSINSSVDTEAQQKDILNKASHSSTSKDGNQTFSISKSDITINDNIAKRNESETDQDSFDSLFTDVDNTTLQLNNITSKVEDTHRYYNSTRNNNDILLAQHYWVDIPNSGKHPLLSNAHRQAITLPLPFKFPFYGNYISNITIATGGFLFTGDIVHSMLAATQYIAPLMANFDTHLSEDSCIKYTSNSTSFTVSWENVVLHDTPNGSFTFQVTLYNTGDIIFVYKDIPQLIYDMTDQHHPIKLGLSDAFIRDRNTFFGRRKTIYEYHQVNFEKNWLKNWTIFFMYPLPTCHTKITCESCLIKDTDFNCQWCNNRCSDGIDRKRDDWLQHNCDKKMNNEHKFCNMTEQWKTSENEPKVDAQGTDNMNALPKKKSSKLLMIGLLILIFVSSFFVWITYAYRNPLTASGQFLIRYRPNQWNGWRKNNARYTAATIHM